jgi:hypothetical protein
VEAADQDLLEHCMERMAEGDAAFLFTFARHFAPHLANVVRRDLADMGRRDVLADADEVGALVLDACHVIFGRARGWHPGGALPWTWAAKAIRAEVARVVGHRTVTPDEDELGGEPSGATPDAPLGADDFRALAARHPLVAQLAEVVAQLGSARDQQVFIEYRLQKELGDPSPSHVVAREFGLTPANVRQIDCRMRRKLAAAVESTPDHAPLRDVRWLAA